MAYTVGYALIGSLLVALFLTPGLAFNAYRKPRKIYHNRWLEKLSEIYNKQIIKLIDMIKGIADAMVTTGLKDAGYIYVNLDDCWHGQRDANGFIQADPTRFKSGIKALAAYVHQKGLKIGIYSDAGRKTCAGRPGSFGHEYQDAIQYANWDIDYLKYDWCNNENINPIGAYSLMRDALRSAGRPIYFSMWEKPKRNNDYHLFFKQYAEKDMASYIKRDRNHPCVILWSIGNEINERADMISE